MTTGLNNKKLKAELSKHSKQDIIDAICSEFNADYLVSNLIRFIFQTESNRALAEEKKAFDEEKKAMEAYVAWNGEVVRKYGDGKEAKIVDIPQKEYERGIRLAKDWETKKKKAEKMTEKVGRILKL